MEFGREILDVRAVARRVGACRYFDAEWYRARYPDVETMGMDPAEHYVLVGAALGRRPGPDFDPDDYVRTHPEAASSNLPPLLHFLASNDRLRERFKGYVDRLTGSGVSGWAVDADNPGKPVTLQVFVDGGLVAEFRTSKRRTDVEATGIRADSAGFDFGWRPGVIPGGATVDVRVKETGESLAKSPRTAPAVPRLTGTSYFELHHARVVRKVRVIVPVFNAYEAVEECLASLEVHCPAYASVLVVNDGSTDPRIPELLARFSRKPRFAILDNGTNLGYTRSINRAIRSCPDEDVVLLNSDTQVTARWLDNLRYCAYAHARHGTVTALSNNAGAFSVPVIGECNEPPPGLDAAQFAAIVAHSTPGTPIEVPTANGFCMYIRRDLLAHVGEFDEERFPRGYGEENDFSMRALRAGWKNVVCDKALVFHKRSQSFKEEKVQLMQQGADQMRMLYPEYKAMTGRYRDLEFSLLRNRIARALATARPEDALPRILFVISTTTGGTPQTNMDLMRSLSGNYNCFLLRCDSRTIFLSELVGDELVAREQVALGREIEPETHLSDEYDRIVAELMYRYAISLVHIRHLLWHGLNLPEVAKAMNIPVVYSMHDFYTVCASHNLLDEKLAYCGGTCTPGQGLCQATLWPHGKPDSLKHGFVHHWRAMFNRTLASCDRFVTTAPSAAGIISANYPVLDGRIDVIPHGRDFDGFHDLAGAPAEGDALKVLVPGNIGPSKGSDLIREMHMHDGGGTVEFHLLGAVARGLSGIGIQHGKYNREDFASFVKEIRPSVGMILSIWPETYCHTLTEMWACGIPVLAMDIGAVGDRIRASGGGWLIPVDAAPDTILATLRAIAADSEEYARRRQAVLEWQEQEGVVNTVKAMSARYQAIYEDLLRAQTGGGE